MGRHFRDVREESASPSTADMLRRCSKRPLRASSGHRQYESITSAKARNSSGTWRLSG
jgi:hypothetical protein